ncbi:hypothetical protein [Sphaerothrix gracilis]
MMQLAYVTLSDKPTEFQSLFSFLGFDPQQRRCPLTTAIAA